ncbi:MAG TPA: RsmD family RNA methyltransferase [Saprospiraceae bacterium]|nr:RsmD family RNA methyltransferase [Saprospiraceae bacterium]
MRIIGGQWKGRRIHIPSNSWPVRPTTDFAREALFNILDNRIEYSQIKALDLFGGTGIHSVELASRGCMDITYVDRHRESTRFVQSLTKEMDLPVHAIQSDVFAFIKKTDRQWNYIFADPPYDLKGLEEFPKFLLESGILTPDGIFVLEHPSKKSFENVPGFREARHYGQSVFSFFGLGS